MIVGNDVVDLAAPRTADRHTDHRFVARVFTEPETEAILAAADPALALWEGWAAKEAAYKAISKALDSPPVFAHRRFEVSWADDGSSGMVRWEGWTVPVRRITEVRAGYVHVLAHLADPRAGSRMRAASARRRHDDEGPAVVERLDRAEAPWSGPLARLLETLTEPERASVHQLPSAAVRIGAREEVARFLDLSPGRVEIVCAPGPYGRRPPAVLVDGGPAKVDVSLSHDGQWIAWALSRL